MLPPVGLLRIKSFRPVRSQAIGFIKGTKSEMIPADDFGELLVAERNSFLLAPALLLVCFSPRRDLGVLDWVEHRIGL